MTSGQNAGTDSEENLRHFFFFFFGRVKQCTCRLQFLVVSDAQTTANMDPCDHFFFTCVTTKD